MKKIGFVSLLVISFWTSAQNVEFKKANFKDQKEALAEAVRNIEVGDYHLFMDPVPQYPQAIPFYMRAYKFNPNDASLNFKLGVAHLHANQKFKALEYFEKAYALKSDVDPAIHYYLGSAAQLLKEWDKATAYYMQYKGIANPKNDNGKIASATKKIEECKTGKRLQESPIRVWIDNLGLEVNSEFSDFGMVMNADGSEIYFTSRRPTSTGGLKDEANDWYEDIYTSRLINGNWTRSENVGAPLNTKGHDAVVALSPDGSRMIIYLDLHENGDLFESVKKNTGWSKPKKLNAEICSDYHESSAWYSPDGKKLFFISDRPLDGKGNAKDNDIYMATWNEAVNDWGNIIRLPETINSEYDEDGIFIHPDGKTMYFSSKGHDNMGGYDIFKAVAQADGSYSKPINIGYPINTPDDDIFFTLTANGRYGYITSYREDGLGEKDLFKITFLGNEKQPVLTTEDALFTSNGQYVIDSPFESKYEPNTSEMALLKGVVSDAKQNTPLAATIEVVNNETNFVIATFQSDSLTGKYLISLPAGINYGIAVKRDGYLFHSENFIIPRASEYESFEKNITLKEVEVGEVTVLRNIFFDLNKYELRKESQHELDRLILLMNQNPTLKIQISGHTDSRGSAAINKELSANRAKAVTAYLVSKGIDASRLESQGVGKDKPIVTDEDIAKLKSEKAKEMAHQSNRRTEFKVISK